MNQEVTNFLNEQHHPLRNEIELLRKCILSANDNLVENIKWNGPNYSYHGEDRITMKIFSAKKIQLIFHRGAKKKTQPTGKLISDNSGLLVWKENDRAIATFETVLEIETHVAILTNIIVRWITATK